MPRMLACLFWVSVANAALPVFVHDAADKVTASFKRQGSRTNVRKIVVEWHPSNLVENTNTIDLTKQVVEIKADNDDWRPPARPALLRSGRFRATFDVSPCLSHKLRFKVSSTEGEEAIFEYPVTVGPASEEDIIKSRFSPSPPISVEVTALTGGQLKVQWAASECATSYEVYGSGQIKSATTTDTTVILDGAKPCETYEISVTAFTGIEASDATTVDFDTKPSINVGEKLDIAVDSEINSAKASWNGWATLSCVADYSVKLCKGDECTEPVIVKRNEYGGNSEFISQAHLEECSEYVMHVEPLFEGLHLMAKKVPFRTLAPNIDDVEQKLGVVTATAGDKQMVTVTWSPVKCAASYEVFQKQSSPDSVWEMMDSVTNNELTIKGVPCTEYSYGVKATIDQKQSGIVEAGSPVKIPLDPSVPYHPPGLKTTPSETMVDVYWEHSSCISSYRMNLCKAGTDECHDSTIDVADANEHSISDSIHNLQACTEYNIRIFATNNDQELGAEHHSFSTLSPPATAPEGMEANLNQELTAIEVNFKPVMCASGYKVYQQLGDDEELKEVADTVMTRTTLSVPQPCQSYKIAVASIVDGNESDPSEIQEGKVPALNDDRNGPTLKVTKTQNTTVHFTVKMPKLNEKCETTVDPTDEEANSLLVPIIIGIMVAIVVLVVAIFFIVKRRKAHSKYDTESAQHAEESKRLKENNGDV